MSQVRILAGERTGTTDGTRVGEVTDVRARSERVLRTLTESGPAARHPHAGAGSGRRRGGGASPVHRSLPGAAGAQAGAVRRDAVAARQAARVEQAGGLP